MARKTEKEETEFKAMAKTLTLCVNKCGVTGNPSTNNMCQKCFISSSSSSSSTASSSLVQKQTPLRLFTKSCRPVSFSPQDLPDSSSGEFISPDPTSSEEGRSKLAPAARKRAVNRCSGCKRKVGLTGIRCRCGEIFCSEHRYTDRHDCSYDYKAAGREVIARENPVVKAAKIIKV